MVEYLLAGLALGSIYAIASSALVVTFVSAGVVNFAFGSMAFVVARFYYWLNSEQGMPTWSAGLLSILVFAPAMGVVFYALLFRHLRGQSTLVKVVATIGLSVALPPISDLIFGAEPLTLAPGLAPPGNEPLRIFNTVVTTDQIVTYGLLLFVVIAGSLVLRYTDVGLRVRAMVDSEAMTSLSGVDPGRIAVGVWAVSAALAGLAGILVAPTNGLTATGMTSLMAAAFAAMIVARLTSLSGAVGASILIGLVTSIIQKYLPPDSSLAAAIIPSIPFGFILLALIVRSARPGGFVETAKDDGPLDAAIKPAGEDAADIGIDAIGEPVWSRALGTIPLVIIAFLPLMFSGSPYWLGLATLGMCYAIVFLSFVLVTGEGGMLWLSQIIFAGVGALGAAQFATVGHLPVLVAILLAGLTASLVGAIIALLTIRLGDLYVALSTLTFGLLVETLVFTRDRFLQGGVGVALARPGFAVADLSFGYLAFGVFLVLGVLTWNLRRSTTGLALRAVRDSVPAARTLGLSLLPIKVLISAVGAFVAAVGGAFLAMGTFIAQPAAFATFAGLVWLAVIVTMGVRSVIAAVLSGLAFAMFPGLLQSYVPPSWGDVPAVLFGLGAIAVARHPEGAVLQNSRALRGLLVRIVRGGSGATPAAVGTIDEVRTPAPLHEVGSSPVRDEAR